MDLAGFERSSSTEPFLRNQLPFPGSIRNSDRRSDRIFPGIPACLPGLPSPKNRTQLPLGEPYRGQKDGLSRPNGSLRKIRIELKRRKIRRRIRIRRNEIYHRIHMEGRANLGRNSFQKRNAGPCGLFLYRNLRWIFF